MKIGDHEIIYPLEFYNGSSRRKEEARKLLNDLYANSDRKEELEKENRLFHTNVIGYKDTFRRGRFFTFDYTYMNDSKQRDYIDIHPMVFVLENIIDGPNSVQVKGFNFNFLPENVRANFMQVYYNLFDEIIFRDLADIQANTLRMYDISEEELDRFLEYLLRQVPQIGGSIRYWNYSQIYIPRVKVVRLEDYHKIFEYTGFENSVLGESAYGVQARIFQDSNVKINF